VEIPQIAFSSELVLNALMAISALHLLSMDPQDHTLAWASGKYLGKALQEHRAAVETMDSRNPEALIIAAVLIAHHHWLSASTKMYQEPYMIDMGTYRFCRGIQALVEKVAPWLLTNVEEQVASVNDQIEYLPFPHFLESAEDDINTLLETLDEDDACHEVKCVYTKVAGFLQATYSRIAHGSFGNPPIEQAITAFLPDVPQLFIKHLEKREPLSMALFARNIALLSILPDAGAWWIHGAGQRKMADTTVNGICELMPPERLWMMDWPLKIISGEITLEN
jgi:Fungal specific transcription factor domain